MYSRAIHIEVLDDLTMDCFMNALRCIICNRGNVRTLHSDNGTNFIGAVNILQGLTKKIAADFNTVKEIVERDIEFHYTTPSASHQGEVRERQIRSVRAILLEILLGYNKRLNTSMLRTHSLRSSCHNKQQTPLLSIFEQPRIRIPSTNPKFYIDGRRIANTSTFRRP